MTPNSVLAQQYQRAVEAAVFFDLAHHGRLEVAGKDAAAFLHNLCTNDTKQLGPDQGCEAFFTNAKARVIAFTWIERLERADGTPLFWVDTGPGLRTVLLQHLDRYLISEEVELADRTTEQRQLHLVGPQAHAALGTIREAVGDLWVWRHDRVALLGYDLVFPASALEQVRQGLTAAGVVAAGPEVYEVLRVEAGLPAHGAEIDDARLAMELGRTNQAISYTKGCYLGQETIVMARDRGHVNRTLLGLKLTGTEPVLPGATVYRGAEEVGQVTSSVFSPRLGRAFALGFLRRGHQQPGTALEVAAGTGRRAAEVAALPLEE